MDFDTPIVDHQTANYFSLKKDGAKISSSFDTLTSLEIRAIYSPFKPSPGLNFQDFGLEFSDSSASPLFPLQPSWGYFYLCRRLVVTIHAF